MTVDDKVADSASVEASRHAQLAAIRSRHPEWFPTVPLEFGRTTDEVVVSFAQVYKKTRVNTDAASAEHGFEWRDPADAAKRELLVELRAMAEARGMSLTVCSQPGLVVEGTAEARCVDARRISEVAGRFVNARLKGGRKECGCFYSRDIGDYDTCPHGCVYCYAVRSRDLASKRFKEHDPDGEFLFPVAGVPTGEGPQKPSRRQLGLFR